MAPIIVSFVPLLAFLPPSTTAFVVPTSSSTHSSPFRTLQSSIPRSSIGRPAAHRALVLPVLMASSDADATAEERAARLRETAAAFRAEAEALESERARARREGADQSFSSFDSDKDGAVGIEELRAGLEGPLRNTFSAQLATKMGRQPTSAEVNAKIAELPGGILFPDDLARRLIDLYDQNGDGVLQQSEFAPADELRARLESIFREVQDEELEVQKVERQREIKQKIKESGKRVRKGEDNVGAATASEKALCALAYLLPLSDIILYAQHIFSVYPDQTAWLQPIAGLLLAYSNLPFAGLATFFGMSFIARKPEVNKLVRFNMLQGINFDIALFPPAILGPILTSSLGQDAYKVTPFTNVASDVLTITFLVCVVYSIASSANGTFPNKVPFFGRINRENPDK